MTDEGDIRETFLGFIKLSSGKAEALAQLVVDQLAEMGIDLQKMRGQVRHLFSSFNTFKIQLSNSTFNTLDFFKVLGFNLNSNYFKLFIDQHSASIAITTLFHRAMMGPAS